MRTRGKPERPLEAAVNREFDADGPALQLALLTQGSGERIKVEGVFRFIAGKRGQRIGWNGLRETSWAHSQDRLPWVPATQDLIHAELDLIQELQTDEYWQDIKAPMLEIVRKRLRNLVKLIEKAKRRIVYTDFEDEIGGPTAIDLPGVGIGVDFERFKAKARHFLKEHENHVAIHKLRTNEPLTRAVSERARVPLNPGKVRACFRDCSLGICAE